MGGLGGFFGTIVSVAAPMIGEALLGPAGGALGGALGAYVGDALEGKGSWTDPDWEDIGVGAALGAAGGLGGKFIGGAADEAATSTGNLLTRSAKGGLKTLMQKPGWGLLFKSGSGFEVLGAGFGGFSAHHWGNQIEGTDTIPIRIANYNGSLDATPDVPLEVPDADDNSPKWPAGVKKPPASFVNNWLDANWVAGQPAGLGALIYTDWSLFGQKNPPAPPGAQPPDAIDASLVATGDSSEVVTNVMQAELTLASAFTALQNADIAMTAKITKAGKDLSQYKSDIEDLISGLNASAPGYPPNGDEVSYITGYVQTALKSETAIMQQAAAAVQSGSDLGDPGNDPALAALQTKFNDMQTSDQSKYNDLLGKYNSLLAGMSGPGSIYSPFSGNPFTGAQFPSVGTSGPYSDPLGLNSGGSTTTSTDPNADLIKAIQGLGSTAGNTTDSSGSGLSGLGSDGSLGSLEQLLLGQQQNRANQAQPATVTTQPTQAPAQPATQPTQQPATAAPAQPAQPAQPAAAPSGPPAPTSTQPVGRVPGPDGSVNYTFPDGKSQKVSLVVAQALDAAFADQNGTDAQAAYNKTAAKWSDTKHIGTRVDPSQLMTGDVATWQPADATAATAAATLGGGSGPGTDGSSGPDAGSAPDGTLGSPPDGSGLGGPGGPTGPAGPGDTGGTDSSGDSDHTALVRVMGSGPDATLDVIINGALVPFDQVPDSFGSFDGFAHPAGIELSTSDDSGASGLVVPVLADPSAGAPTTA